MSVKYKWVSGSGQAPPRPLEQVRKRLALAAPPVYREVRSWELRTAT